MNDVVAGEGSDSDVCVCLCLHERLQITGHPWGPERLESNMLVPSNFPLPPGLEHLHSKGIIHGGGCWATPMGDSVRAVLEVEFALRTNQPLLLPNDRSLLQAPVPPGHAFPPTIHLATSILTSPGPSTDLKPENILLKVGAHIRGSMLVCLCVHGAGHFGCGSVAEADGGAVLIRKGHTAQVGRGAVNITAGAWHGLRQGLGTGLDRRHIC